MADGDLSDQITQIEVHIEELAVTLDRCRKAMSLSKLAAAAGAVWMLAYFLGAISVDPATMIIAIAAIVGGVVVFGSNSSTLKQTAAEMTKAEAQRIELIEMIDLQTIGTGRAWRPSGFEAEGR